MKRIITYLMMWMALSAVAFQAHAQTEDEQLLIFRNTGETNLFYQSEIDSITLTKVDSLGVEHEEPIAQLFHTADTTLYVELAEIDSVCFGSRNEIEYRSDVRVLDDGDDMQWIIRYDGECIYYKTLTPTDVLPKVGQKLFFSQQTEMFPCGLSAKVTNVVYGSSEIAVAVSSADYSEIFKKFFYAGSLGNNSEAKNESRMRHAVELGGRFGVNYTLEMEDVGEFDIDGGLSVNGKFVANPLKNYYHADIDVSNDVDMTLKAKAAESAEHSFEKVFLHVPIQTSVPIFQPSIDVGLFADLKAEMSFNYEMQRVATTRFSWTKRGSEQTFERSNPTEEGQQVNEAKIHITLDGSIFAGILAGVNFNLVGDIAGATAKAKLGMEFSGELGMGLLNDLSQNYSVEPYGKAELGLTAKFKVEGYLTHRNWLIGDVEEEKIVEYEQNLWERKVDLFPRFFAPRAVVAPSNEEVSVAVKSDNEIAYPVETGFQVLTERPDTTHEVVPVEEVFVKDIEVEEGDSVQSVDTIMALPETMADVDSVFVRPVFHYAGYTIPHETVSAVQDANIQPIIFSMTNGAATIVSGVPVVGNVKVDSTQYHIGPFVAVPYYDKTIHKNSPYAGIGNGLGYIYSEDNDCLIGDWSGQIGDESIDISFEKDGTCSYRCKDMDMQDAEYAVNEPQSGKILIQSGTNSLVLTLQSVESSYITVKFGNTIHKGKVCTFVRKN